MLKPSWAATPAGTRPRTVLFGAPFDSTTSYRPGYPLWQRRHPPRSPTASRATAPTRTGTWLDAACVRQRGSSSCASATPRLALESIDAAGRRNPGRGQAPLHAGRRAPGDAGRFPGGVRKSIPDVHIIHFDAHADLRDDYLGVQLSHACVHAPLLGACGRRHASSSSASARATGRSFAGDAATCSTHKFDFDTAWRSVVEQLQGQAGLLHPGSGCAGPVGLSRAPAPRSRAASALRSCERPLPWSARSCGLSAATSTS